MAGEGQCVIVALIADRETVCVGQSVRFTATTQPPEEVVTWRVDGQDAETIGKTFDTSFRAPGQHVVEAICQSSVRSVTVNTVDVQIGSLPSPLHISPEPQMPEIVARALVLGGSESGFNWTIDIGFQANDCFPNGPDRHIGLQSMHIGEQINFDLRDRIRGGGLSVRVRTSIGGAVCEDSANSVILGTNPDQTDVQAALPHDTLRRIACRESLQRQFDAPPNGGVSYCPLFSADRQGRVGIMQIADSTDDEVFNWRLNVARGIAIFKERVRAARSFPRRVRESSQFIRLVDAFNERRRVQGLAPLRIVLPSFTRGDFDRDLQQLELDSIRGYNGWFGEDAFGHELHEFRVAIDSIDGEEVLRLLVDEQARMGEAVWEPVPVADRPSDSGAPNYVNEVLGFLPGCSPPPPPPPCTIAITNPPRERCFSPPAATGSEIFRAVLGGPPPPGSAVRWEVVLGSGTGTVEFAAPDQLTTEVFPRQPNRVRVRVKVERGGQVLCQSSPDTLLSVPQFFQVIFLSDFDVDLERLGLRRRAAPNALLTPGQMQTNRLVREAVIDEMLRTCGWAFRGVNVRFITGALPPHVGFEHVTGVFVGGPTRDLPAFAVGLRGIGFTYPPEGANKGKLIDDQNLDPAQTIAIFSGELANRSNFNVWGDDIYRDILDPLFVEDLAGSGYPGRPVDDGDFLVPAPEHPTTRQLNVMAATSLIGRILGFTVAHECGHALGLPHNRRRMFTLMDDRQTFMITEGTGILNYDKTTGAFRVTDAVDFSLDNLRELAILPILR